MVRLHGIKHLKLHGKGRSKKKRRASISRSTETDFEQVEMTGLGGTSPDGSFSIWMGGETSTPVTEDVSPVWCTRKQVKLNDHSAHSIVLFDDTMDSPKLRHTPGFTGNPGPGHLNSPPLSSITPIDTDNRTRKESGLCRKRLDLSPIQVYEQDQIHPNSSLRCRVSDDNGVDKKKEGVLPPEVDGTCSLFEEMHSTSTLPISNSNKRVNKYSGSDGRETNDIMREGNEHNCGRSQIPSIDLDETEISEASEEVSNIFSNGEIEVGIIQPGKATPEKEDCCQKMDEATIGTDNIDFIGEDPKDHDPLRSQGNNNWKLANKENESHYLPDLRNGRSRRGVVWSIGDSLLDEALIGLGEIGLVAKVDEPGSRNIHIGHTMEGYVERHSRSKSKVISVLGDVTNVHSNRTKHEPGRNSEGRQGQQVFRSRPPSSRQPKPSVVKKTITHGSSKRPDRLGRNRPIDDVTHRIHHISEELSKNNNKCIIHSDDPDRFLPVKLPTELEKVTIVPHNQNDSTEVFSRMRVPTDQKGVRGVDYESRLDQGNCGEPSIRHGSQSSYYFKPIGTLFDDGQQIQYSTDSISSRQTPETLVPRREGMGREETQRSKQGSTRFSTPANPTGLSKKGIAIARSNIVQAVGEPYHHFRFDRDKFTLMPDHITMESTSTSTKVVQASPCSLNNSERRNICELSQNDKQRQSSGSCSGDYLSKSSRRGRFSLDGESGMCSRGNVSVSSTLSSTSTLSSHQASKDRTDGKVSKLLELFENQSSYSSTLPRSGRPSSPRKRNDIPLFRSTSSVSSRVSTFENEYSDTDSSTSFVERGPERSSFRNSRASSHEMTDSDTRNRRMVSRSRSEKMTRTSAPASRVVVRGDTNVNQTITGAGQSNSLAGSRDTTYAGSDGYTPGGYGTIPNQKAKGNRLTREGILLYEYSCETKHGLAHFQRGEVVRVLSNWVDGQVRVRKYEDDRESLLPRKCLFFMSSDASSTRRRRHVLRSSNNTTAGGDQHFPGQERYLMEPYLVVRPHIAEGSRQVTVLRGEVVVIAPGQSRDQHPVGWRRVYVPRTQGFGLIPSSMIQPLTFKPKH